MKTKVLSTKINEDDLKRLEKTKEILFKQGKLPRDTNSCMLRESLKITIAETLEGKKEKREEELEKMKQKLRDGEKEIGELEAENQRLKNEKTYLERKLKNSEKSIGELSYTNNAFQYANQKLMKENQDLKGHQLSPELKGIIDMYKEATKLECTMTILKKIIQRPTTY